MKIYKYIYGNIRAHVSKDTNRLSKYDVKQMK